MEIEMNDVKAKEVHPFDLNKSFGEEVKHLNNLETQSMILEMPSIIF